MAQQPTSYSIFSSRILNHQTLIFPHHPSRPSLSSRLQPDATRAERWPPLTARPRSSPRVSRRRYRPDPAMAASAPAASTPAAARPDRPRPPALPRLAAACPARRPGSRRRRLACRRGRPSGSAPGRCGGRPSSMPSPGPTAGTGPAASPGLRAAPGRGSGRQPPKARRGPWRRVGAAALSAWSGGRRASAAREAPAGARSFRRPALPGFPRRWTPLPAR